MEITARAIYLGLLLGSFIFAFRSLGDIFACVRARLFAKANCDAFAFDYRLDPEDTTATSLRAYYAFSVKGKTYTSDQICYGIPPLQTLEKLRQQESGKQPLPVYYSPFNPQRCVLVRSVCPSSVAMLLFFGCAFVTLAMILVSGSLELFIRQVVVDSGVGGVP